MSVELVVMAAGMGSRYGGLKQLEPVGPNGETVMDYSVYDAVASGISKVVFVIRRDIEQAFVDQIGRRYAGVLDVAYAFQELDDLPGGRAVPSGRTKPWGTGQAVLAAAAEVAHPFVVINADDFYGRAAYGTLAGFLDGGGQPGEYGMVAFRLDRTLSEHGTVSRGVCDVEDGRLRRVVEHTGIGRDTDGIGDVSGRRFTGAEPVSMNMWGLRPDVFGWLEQEFVEFLDAHGAEPKSELYLPAVLDRLVERGEASVTVLESPESWFGVTYREDAAQVRQAIGSLVEAGAYPAHLWSVS